MRQMTAMRQVHAQHLIAWLQQRKINRRVGLRTAMGLHIGMLRAKKLLSALSCQILHHVHILTTAIITLARVTLGIFIGQHTALRLHYGQAGKVL